MKYSVVGTLIEDDLRTINFEPSIFNSEQEAKSALELIYKTLMELDLYGTMYSAEFKDVIFKITYSDGQVLIYKIIENK